MIDFNVRNIDTSAYTQKDGLTAPATPYATGSMAISITTGMGGVGNEPADSGPQFAGTWTKIAYGTVTRDDNLKLATCIYRQAVTNNDPLQIYSDIFDWDAWANVIGIQVNGHDTTTPIRQFKIGSGVSQDADGAAATVTLDQAPLPGNAILLVVSPSCWGDVQTIDTPSVDGAWAGPERPMTRLHATVGPAFSAQGVFSYQVIGGESTTLFVRQLGKKVTNWMITAIEINAYGTRGVATGWSGGLRREIQVGDGIAFSASPERDGAALVFAEDFSGNYAAWESVQVAPGGVPYNSNGAGYSGSNSLRFENYLGRRCMHVRLSQGEAPISGNPTFRAEIASPSGRASQVFEGSERWVGFDWRADAFPDITDADGWTLLSSWHHSGPTGTAPLQLNVDTNQVLFFENSGTSTRVPLAPVAWFKGSWHRISYHVLFSYANGWIEGYVDGMLVAPRTAIRTMNSGDPMNYPKIGHYERETATTVKESGFSNFRITAVGSKKPTPSTPVPPPFMWAFGGNLAPVTGVMPIHNDCGFPVTVTTVRAYIATAPTGSATVFTIKKNGTAVFSVSVAAGSNTAALKPPFLVLNPGDRLTVDIASVGSTTPGANAVITAAATV